MGRRSLVTFPVSLPWCRIYSGTVTMARVSVVLWKGIGQGPKAGPLYTQGNVSSGLRLPCTNQIASIQP